MSSSKADRILQKLSERSTAAGLPSRSDLYVADVQAIDNTKCRVLVGYHKGNKVPSIAQLEQFFNHTFGNKVVAQTSSATSHPENAAISILATLNSPTRPLADINDMIRVSSNSYMDENTQHIWQVVDTGQVKYLSRQSNENIADIVEARKARTHKDARFSGIKTAAPLAMSGDQVKFMSPQNVILMGEITSISEAKATISANGSSYTVDRQAIIQVVDRSSKSVQSSQNVLEDYFTKAYGDADFAKQLTDKQSVEMHGLGSTVPSTPSAKVPSRKEDNK